MANPHPDFPLSRWDSFFVSLGAGLAGFLTWFIITGELHGEWRRLIPLVDSLAFGLAYYFLRKVAELPSKKDVFHESPPRSAEDRLDELERLKRRDLVTPEEYAVKRQEILKDL